MGISEKANVYEKLKEEIMYMELLPGQVISEIDTSHRFSVSRTPVRDAFKRLEIDGLLEIKSHSGTIVTLIDLTQISDILYMREKLELGVIEINMKTLDNTAIIKIKMILERQRLLFEKGLGVKELAKEFIKSDNEFHQMMFTCAGKIGVWKYLLAVEHHYERMRMFLNIEDEKYLYSLYEDHVAILQGMIQKDIEGVQKIFIRHLTMGMDRGVDKVLEKEEYFKDF